MRLVTLCDSDAIQMYVNAQGVWREKTEAGTALGGTPALTWYSQVTEKGGLLGNPGRIIRNTQEIYSMRYCRIQGTRVSKRRKRTVQCICQSHCERRLGSFLSCTVDSGSLWPKQFGSPRFPSFNHHLI